MNCERVAQLSLVNLIQRIMTQCKINKEMHTIPFKHVTHVHMKWRVGVSMFLLTWVQQSSRLGIIEWAFKQRIICWIFHYVEWNVFLFQLSKWSRIGKMHKNEDIVDKCTRISWKKSKTLLLIIYRQFFMYYVKIAKFFFMLSYKTFTLDFYMRW